MQREALFPVDLGPMVDFLHELDRPGLVDDDVVVVQFRGDKVACERIYWDHAAVLRQVGLLKE